MNDKPKKPNSFSSINLVCAAVIGCAIYDVVFKRSESMDFKTMGCMALLLGGGYLFHRFKDKLIKPDESN
jgi:hypothetical protein